MPRKKVAILGSTGSIGRGALKVIDHLKGQFEVTALAACENIDLLEEQAKAFSPEIIAVANPEKAQELAKRLPHIPILPGEEGVIAVAEHAPTDLLLSAMSGFSGVLPTLKGIEAGKAIALANKEALVSGGTLVTRLAKEKGVPLIPVDSEHTALFQCLNGEEGNDISRLVLTASGGPFRMFTDDELDQVNTKSALAHPNYQMGAKVSIDSSTLMNKGLEMIEAHFLYDLPIDQIEILVHPEQVIHGMVEFIDGSILAQLGRPDMLVPIQYALTYPRRCTGLLKPLDFTRYPALHFSAPNTDRFRCLALAYDSLKEGRSMPAFMNAANEVLVDRFLSEQITWKEIGQKLETLMSKHTPAPIDSFDTLNEIDKVARMEALEA